MSERYLCNICDKIFLYYFHFFQPSQQVWCSVVQRKHLRYIAFCHFEYIHHIQRQKLFNTFHVATIVYISQTGHSRCVWTVWCTRHPWNRNQCIAVSFQQMCSSKLVSIGGPVQWWKYPLCIWVYSLPPAPTRWCTITVLKNNTYICTIFANAKSI